MQRLVQIMKDKKISQAELHRLSGVSQSHISDIIRGEKNPTLQILKKLANGLEVSLIDILDDHPLDMRRTG